jgi:hypothetical protein
MHNQHMDKYSMSPNNTTTNTTTCLTAIIPGQPRLAGFSLMTSAETEFYDKMPLFKDEALESHSAQLRDHELRQMGELIQSICRVQVP